MTDEKTTKTTKQRAKDVDAKVPADRAAKAEAIGEVTIEHQGLTFTINPDVIDDDDAMSAAERGANPWPLLTLMVGEDRVAEVKNHLRDETGRLRRSDVFAFTMGLMKELGQEKA